MKIGAVLCIIGLGVPWLFTNGDAGVAIGWLSGITFGAGLMLRRP